MSKGQDQEANSQFPGTATCQMANASGKQWGMVFLFCLGGFFVKFGRQIPVGLTVCELQGPKVVFIPGGE